jgi:D-arabinose 1-dehydrogenase-like Zn-dependent alcohol dehydrogenase
VPSPPSPTTACWARPRVVGEPGGVVRPLGHITGVRLASLRASQKAVFFMATFNREDFLVLAELLEAGKVTSVIDRQDELAEASAALNYLREGHARARVILTV